MTLPSHANSKNAIHMKYFVGGVTLPSQRSSTYKIFGGRLVKFAQVHWLGKEFYETVVTQTFGFCSVLK